MRLVGDADPMVIESKHDLKNCEGEEKLVVEGMNVVMLEEGSKDCPNKYRLSMRLWGAVGLPKKKS